jgi:thioredoxin reductase
LTQILETVHRRTRAGITNHPYCCGGLHIEPWNYSLAKNGERFTGNLSDRATEHSKTLYTGNQKEYESVGIKVHKNSKDFSKIEKNEDGTLKLHYEDATFGKGILEVDCLIWAIGRVPETEQLRLKEVGVATDEKGQVKVDEYQNSSVPGIYSIGDVTGQVELTPGTTLYIFPALHPSS